MKTWPLLYAPGRREEVMCLRTTAPRAASREKIFPTRLNRGAVRKVCMKGFVKKKFG